MDAQYEFDTTPAHLRVRFPTNDKLMIDFVARCPTDRSLSIGGDARVVAPMAPSWLERAEASYRTQGRVVPVAPRDHSPNYLVIFFGYY
jgi:hypothetical protein